jgi:hypothetical protein
MERCRCRDCLAGDALPPHLQGWPGAWQMMLIPTGHARATMIDPVKSACAERCANTSGDAPCYEVCADIGQEWKPCAECLIECGIEPVEPIDPDAVVRPLL